MSAAHPQADSRHAPFMQRALDQARCALVAGEVPIGAVLVIDERVVAEGHNQPIGSLDPTAHAEIVVLREAARRLGNYRLPGSVLYVTLEPCLMCVGALLSARVSRVVFGAAEPKFGAVVSLLDASALRTNHHFEVVSGVLEEECSKLVRDFFRTKRQEE